jgi:nucleotide-binding universal stress UspA family protein
MEGYDMFKTMVVPVDGSDAAGKAVEVASTLAARDGARVVLLHVVTGDETTEDLARFAEVEGMAEPAGQTYAEPVVAGPPHGIVPRPPAAKAHVDNHATATSFAPRILEEARLKACDCGVENVETATSDGDPVDCILERARAENADAIVMGSRGLSDLKGTFVGSVSHKVAHDADCTCITVT